MTRGGMAAVINQQADLEVCAEASTGAEALSLAGRSRPDLIITDITLPGRSGLELIKDLQVSQPDLPVLVVTLHDESLYAERALRAGARGYLMKDAGAAKLLEAIRQVLQRQTYVSPQLAARIVDLFSGRQPRKSSSPIERLTDREFEVFQLIGKGKTSKQIAQELHLSPKTVDVHRGHIKEKLGISDVTALVSHAARWVEAQHGDA
jgi:DNA-binding NarL/FixJ family response regulator